MPVARAQLRKVMKGAGAVVLGFLALNLIATVAIFAIGARWLGR